MRQKSCLYGENMFPVEGSLAYPKSWLDKKGDPPNRSHFLDGKPVSPS